MISGNIVNIENDIILEISTNSARRLIKGGAAILAEIVTNQHNAILGVSNNIPLLINSLREKVFS